MRSRKTFGLRSDVGGFGDDHEQEAAPESSHLPDGSQQPFPEKDEQNKQINNQQCDDDLRGNINTKMHRQDYPAKCCPKRTALFDPAEQEVEFQGHKPGSLDVSNGSRTAKVQLGM